jgi:aryl-alcohol dehydrogenase-like predicted oxidoreductase
VRSTEALAADDLRRRVPRFDPENFDHNLQLVDALSAIAREAGCTPAQLALAWVLAQGDDVIALPGCERVAHVEENAPAASVQLPPELRARIDALVPPGSAAGARLRDQRFIHR